MDLVKKRPFFCVELTSLKTIRDDMAKLKGEQQLSFICLDSCPG